MKNHLRELGWFEEGVRLAEVELVLNIASEVASDQAEKEIDQELELEDAPEEVAKILLETDGCREQGEQEDKYN